MNSCRGTESSFSQISLHIQQSTSIWTDHLYLGYTVCRRADCSGSRSSSTPPPPPCSPPARSCRWCRLTSTWRCCQARVVYNTAPTTSWWSGERRNPGEMWLELLPTAFWQQLIRTQFNLWWPHLDHKMRDSNSFCWSGDKTFLTKETFISIKSAGTKPRVM